jgi:2-keto-3-deoxy-L-rhamnonate aldolase RhmA
MIFVGPGDLACSLGIADPADPELRETVESVLSRSRVAGRLTGVFAASPAEARRWREAATDLVILGSDLTWLACGVAAAVAESGANG